jgi:hypothetical protein
MKKKNDIETPEENEESLINNNALSAEQEDDEATLTQALQANPFKRFFIRLVIKLKNHLTTIPMLLCVVSLMIITFTIHQHVNAMMMLINDGMNAFYFFCNVLLSLVLVLVYLRINGKGTSKKQLIIMYVLFGLVLAGELFFDFYHLHDISIETGLVNSLNKVTDDPKYHYVSLSQHWTVVHIVMLFVTLACVIIAPLIQPLFKKIHIKVK